MQQFIFRRIVFPVLPSSGKQAWHFSIERNWSKLVRWLVYFLQASIYIAMDHSGENMDDLIKHIRSAANWIGPCWLFDWSLPRDVGCSTLSVIPQGCTWAKRFPKSASSSWLTTHSNFHWFHSATQLWLLTNFLSFMEKNKSDELNQEALFPT